MTTDTASQVSSVPPWESSPHCSQQQQIDTTPVAGAFLSLFLCAVRPAYSFHRRRTNGLTVAFRAYVHPIQVLAGFCEERVMGVPMSLRTRRRQGADWELFTIWLENAEAAFTMLASNLAYMDQSTDVRSRERKRSQQFATLRGGRCHGRVKKFVRKRG